MDIESSSNRSSTTAVERAVGSIWASLMSRARSDRARRNLRRSIMVLIQPGLKWSGSVRDSGRNSSMIAAALFTALFVPKD